MILNLHEMFILDWIHECRQSSLGGFPVWSIVLGFVSHVLLVSLLLFTTFTLWSSLDVLFFSANQNQKMFCTHTLHTGGELLSKPVHLLRNRSQVFHLLCHCNAFWYTSSSVMMSSPDFGRNVGSISFVVMETELHASVLRPLPRWSSHSITEIAQDFFQVILWLK